MPESVTYRLNSSNIDQLSMRELRAILVAVVDALNNISTKLDTAGGSIAGLGTNYAATTTNILTK